MKVRSVFVVEREAVELGVSARLLGCPFLVGDDPARRQINRYLEDRFLGRWQPRCAIRRRRFRPSHGTVKQIAHRLCNFVQWLESKGRSWSQANEADLDEYAEEMENGSWTVDLNRKGLAASTIAGRQIDVIQAMLWEVDRDERSFTPGVRMQSTKLGTAGGSRRTVHRTMYDVVRRVAPAEIVFPTAQQVDDHIAGIADPALQLGVKLVYRCGLRASEPGALLVSDLPGQRRVGPFGFLSVLGKGKKRRRTELNLEFEEELSDFVKFEWVVRMKRRAKENDPLLINIDGRPISYRAIWLQFAATGWTPHMGRHFYAIQYLLHGWEAQKTLAKRHGYLLTNDQMPSLLSQELLLLMKNLGHAELSTTQKYLVALSQFTRNSDIALAFQDELFD